MDRPIAASPWKGRFKRFARLAALGGGTLLLGLIAISGLRLATLGSRVLREIGDLAQHEYFHVEAQPLRVQAGLDARSTGIASRLARSGLRYVPASPGPGEYSSSSSAIRYRALDANGDAPLVVLGLSGGVVASLERGGNYVDAIDLPAERLTSFRTGLLERRAPVRYEDIPVPLVAAVLAAEDRRFFSHPGLDWRGIARAMARNARRGRVVEGGSTITQQTVKLILNRTRRELPAKVDEALLALLAERRFTKQEILQVYLDNVYLGQEGPFQVHGIAEGARYFFDKPLAGLSDTECFELAAAIRAPNAASPRRHRERLEEYTRAIARAVPEIHVPETHAPPRRPLDAFEDTAPHALAAVHASARIDFSSAQVAYYFDLLEREWKILREQYDIRPPATLVASLDPVLQSRTADALQRGLKRAGERQRKKSQAPLQGAVAAIDPRTGAVRALLGGSDYSTAPFNRALSMARHVGSTFKPFVYLSAFGGVGAQPILTQSSWLRDEQQEYQVGRQTWAPANFDGQFRGWVTVRQALEKSVNAATVELGMKVGVENVADLARSVGLQKEIAPNPSVLLGAVETSPLRLAGAYCAIANGGLSVTPSALLYVRSGERRWALDRPQPQRVASSQGTYIVTDMLVGALRTGTGSSAAQYGYRHVAAGKTGTSDKARDTWFVGYTPDLVMSVWVGYDDNAPTGLSGASGALPIWAMAMGSWQGGGWDTPFDLPPGVTFRTIDPVTGDLAHGGCPDSESAAYLDDSEPEYSCSLHPPAFGDDFERFFDPDKRRERDDRFQLPRKGTWWNRLKNVLGV